MKGTHMDLSTVFTAFCEFIIIFKVTLFFLIKQIIDTCNNMDQSQTN